MPESKSKLEQDQPKKPVSFLSMVIMTGFFGGILWSTIGYVAYIFNFTEIHPNVVLEPWAIGTWKKGWLGTVISILFIGGVSILAALIYYAAFRKLRGSLPGMIYGALLFLLVFIVLNPIFPGIKPLWSLDKNTITTSLCIYILFGTFVGYSISYEQEELDNTGHRDKSEEPETT